MYRAESYVSIRRGTKQSGVSEMVYSMLCGKVECLGACVCISVLGCGAK